MRLCSYPAKPGVNSDADTGEDWNSSVSQKQAVFFSLFLCLLLNWNETNDIDLGCFRKYFNFK